MASTNIKEFIAAVSAYEDRRDVAIEGLTTDNQFYRDTIAELQANPGTFSPEDQALVDAMEARLGASVAKEEALDSLHPPVPPQV